MVSETLHGLKLPIFDKALQSVENLFLLIPKNENLRAVATQFVEDKLGTKFNIDDAESQVFKSGLPLLLQFEDEDQKLFLYKQAAEDIPNQVVDIDARLVGLNAKVFGLSGSDFAMRRYMQHILTERNRPSFKTQVGWTYSRDPRVIFEDFLKDDRRMQSGSLGKKLTLAFGLEEKGKYFNLEPVIYNPERDVVRLVLYGPQPQLDPRVTQFVNGKVQVNLDSSGTVECKGEKLDTETTSLLSNLGAEWKRLEKDIGKYDKYSDWPPELKEKYANMVKAYREVSLGDILANGRESWIDVESRFYELATGFGEAFFGRSGIKQNYNRKTRATEGALMVEDVIERLGGKRRPRYIIDVKGKGNEAFRNGLAVYEEIMPSYPVLGSVERR